MKTVTRNLKLVGVGSYVNHKLSMVPIEKGQVVRVTEVQAELLHGASLAVNEDPEYSWFQECKPGTPHDVDLSGVAEDDAEDEEPAAPAAAKPSQRVARKAA